MKKNLLITTIALAIAITMVFFNHSFASKADEAVMCAINTSPSKSETSDVILNTAIFRKVSPNQYVAFALPLAKATLTVTTAEGEENSTQYTRVVNIHEAHAVWENFEQGDIIEEIYIVRPPYEDVSLRAAGLLPLEVQGGVNYIISVFYK